MSPNNTASSALEPKSLLDDLRTIEEYQQRNERFFPSVEAVRWYFRQNRKGLESCGALLLIHGRLYVRPELAERFALEAGLAAAKRHGGAS